MAVNRRSYRSPVREAQSQQTRTSILEAAARLFGEQGYSATTLKSIAEEAGVSEQTIYATFGNKVSIVKALLEVTRAHALQQGGREELLREEDPRRQLELMALFDRRLFEHGADLIGMLRDAGRAEPELAAIYEEGRGRARAMHREIVATWAGKKALKPGLTADRATDVYGALSNVDVFRSLVRERGWPADEYQRWLAESLSELLFAE